jgi:hypothetical protein
MSLQYQWSRFVKQVAHSAGFEQQRAHHFHPGVLNRDATVIDLGVHKGEFARFISETYGCSVLGLEANPHLFARLPTLPRVKFLNLSENPEASSVFEGVAQATGYLNPVEVRGITLDSLIISNGVSSVELLKVDIESAEFDMFERAGDETLTRAVQITVEFHLGPAGSEFSPDRLRRISRRLERLGFATYVMDRNFTDVLFLNTRRLTPTFPQRLAQAAYRHLIMPARSLF